MRIPIHTLLEEAFGISKITNKKDLEKLALKLRKEGEQIDSEDIEGTEREIEARKFEKD